MKKKNVWDFHNTLFSASQVEECKYTVAIPCLQNAKIGNVKMGEEEEMSYRIEERWCFVRKNPKDVVKMETKYKIPKHKILINYHWR